MSEKQILKLLSKLKDDAGFRGKLQSLEGLDATSLQRKVSEQIDDVVDIAKEAGLDLSREDLIAHFKATVTLSDAELEACAGGVPCSADPDVVKGWFEQISLNHQCPA